MLPESNFYYSSGICSLLSNYVFMDKIKLAVICLGPVDDGCKPLLTRKIAGIELFKRLVLTLNRSGLDEIIVVSNKLASGERQRIVSDIRNDARFKGKLTWYDYEEYFQTNGDEKVRSLAGTHGILLISGNIVTTIRRVKDFINKSLNSTNLERETATILSHSQNNTAGFFLLPINRLDIIEKFFRKYTIERPVEATPSVGKHNTFVFVRDISTFNKAKRWLINQQKLNYTQLMDVWFNCLFSIRISSWLVKAPFTPNQLTLFGLVFGVLAGWLFACGDYASGLFGGLLLALTAIWDCCDGDVARLKFMESDFGEYLDTTCDNIINVFVFTGLFIGVAKVNGLISALVPFALLMLGGGLIFVLIYFPKGAGKGNSFKGTRMYDVIRLLASRNFIYVILLFAVLGKLDWFLWLAGFGAYIFAIALFLIKISISKTAKNIF